MEAFKALCEKATGRPWRHGTSIEGKTYHSNHIVEVATDSSVATVYGIPQNARLEEFQHEPQWAVGLANARLLTIGANRLELLVKQQQWMLEKLDAFIHEHDDPGADALACVQQGRKLLAQIEAEAAQ